MRRGVIIFIETGSMFHGNFLVEWRQFMNSGVFTFFFEHRDFKFSLGKREYMKGNHVWTHCFLEM